MEKLQEIKAVKTDKEIKALWKIEGERPSEFTPEAIHPDNAEKTAPVGFKTSRPFELQRHLLERTIKSDQRGSSTMVTLQRISFALQRAVYNASYYNGNEATNSGILAEDGIIKTGQYQGKKLGYYYTDGTQSKYGPAEIWISQKELASYAFGVDDPNNRQKKDAVAALEDINSVKLSINLEDGVLEHSLVNVLDTFTDHKTKAKSYHLLLSPLFTAGVKNYGMHPQNIMSRIGNVTEAKLNLLRFLGVQRKDFVRIINLADILEELNLESEYKSKKSRALKKLEEAIASMVECGLLLELPKIDERGKDPESILYSFKFNPDYGKSPLVDTRKKIKRSRKKK